MPDRSLLLNLSETTIPRRSPRLLHLKTPSKTPKSPISDPSLSSSTPSSSSSSRSRSRSRNKLHNNFPEKISKVKKKSFTGSRTCQKLASGSTRVSRFSNNCNLDQPETPIVVALKRKSLKGSKESGNCEKSANGLRRSSRLSGIEGLRRSPRFRNEVHSLVSVPMSCNVNPDGSIHGNCKSRRASKQVGVVGTDNVTLHCVEDCPVTPVRVTEKKFRGDDGKDGVEVGGSCGKFLGNSERRITRSCSKQMGGRILHGKIGEDKQEGNVVSKRKKKAARQPQSEVGNDSCVGTVNGFKGSNCGSVSPPVTPGGAQQKQRKPKVNQGKYGQTADSCGKIDGNFERRITRSASKLKAMGENTSLCPPDVERRNRHTKSRNLAIKGDGVTKTEEKRGGNRLRIEPRKRTRCRSVASFATRLEEEAGTRDIDGKKKESYDCGRQDVGKQEKGSCDAIALTNNPGEGQRKAQDLIDKDNKLIGVKRKRKQAYFQGTDQGWTKEQQVALQRAYFTAKPSPHFWKKVAKLVPGKSAQECFDKVHSDNLTPVPTQPSSRATKWNSPSDLSISGIQLFKSAEKSKKTGRTNKRKSHIAARKTVRHLLQKYCHVNEDSEADMFSALEPTANPSAGAFQLTPEHQLETPGSSSKYRDRSLSSHRKQLSRFSSASASESPLTSPPVLKKVKNLALHEKYIDQLHTREAKRKVASTRYLKSILGRKDVADNSATRKEAVRAAKDALVSEATDVINKFRYSQANIMDALSDMEEVSNSDDEEEEIVL